MTDILTETSDGAGAHPSADTTQTHTPGPWYVRGQESIWVATHDATNAPRICTMNASDNEFDDALLIAAAPDMLAALQQVVREAEAFYRETGAAPESPCVINARAVIAKALPNWKACKPSSDGVR